MAERSNAAVLKTVLLKGNGGSNPSSSAITSYDEGTRLGTGSKGTIHIGCYVVKGCNDSETNDGTDAMNEMVTFETRIKE